jgi:hypothetical protein
MKEQRKTASMLARLPVILAVTAASYGLPLDTQRLHDAQGARKATSAPAGAVHARLVHERHGSRH